MSSSVFHFDPYSSQVDRMGKPMNLSGANSKLEEKVAALQAAREQEVISAGIPERNLQVYDTKTQPKVASAELPLSYSRRVDQKLLKEAVDASYVVTKREQGFQTKAMRDLNKLQGSKVYTKATIKVQFPDGLVVQAEFSPLERLTEVEAEVKRCMRSAEKTPFYLFERPRRQRLQSEQTLKDLGLVPASKLFAAWEGEAPEGEYLREELVNTMEVPQVEKAKKRRSMFF